MTSEMSPRTADRERRHDTVLLDVDGTLVDSTYHHAMAWHRAFLAHDLRLSLWRLHRAVGMGGDLFVAAVAGDDVEERLGDALRQAWEREYDQLRHSVRVLPGARELIGLLKDRGLRLALASSGKARFTTHALELLGLDDQFFDAVTSSDDADHSKPAPDILQVALERSGGTSAIVIGDGSYDVTSAARIGAPCVVTRTGGFGVDELERAGAVLVVDDLTDLLDADWDALVTARPPQGAGTLRPPTDTLQA